MKTNTVAPAPLTHEGAKAKRITPEQMLRRSVMACMLWEDEFYESGETIAKRIAELVPRCSPEFVSATAIEARTQMHLRHAPLWLAVAMCDHPAHRARLALTLPAICLRADEPAEFLAMYWKNGRRKVPAQVKKGLAKAFQRFNPYQLGKYNRDGAVRLRDALFICHPKPTSPEQQEAWNKLVSGTLEAPDTWEVNLSAGKDKAETFIRLMAENKLGAMALLRNLRNMIQSGVDEATIRQNLKATKAERVLPFRFIAAARAVPQLEDAIEEAMLRCLASFEKLPGKTAIVVDNSGSMMYRLSAKSDLSRIDAACALAVIVREVCEHALVIGFGSDAGIIPNRRGFALVDAIKRGPGGGTYTDHAINLANSQGYDRIILITDEQSRTRYPDPLPGTRPYAINVASARNGIGYGAWTHLDGWSEAIMQYIAESESPNALPCTA